MRAGECLRTDTPDNIRAAFPHKLWAAGAPDMYSLLKDIRAYEGTYSCYAFGDKHHLIFGDTGNADSLLSFLARKGYTDIDLKPMEPTVEDCFMDFEKEGR